MDINDLAAWLLIFMPFSFAAKTLAVAFLAGMLAGQRTDFDYGKYSVRFFVWLTIISALLTVLFGLLAREFHDEPGLAPWLLILVPVEAATWMVTAYGRKMVRAEKEMP